jgi:hypothetical protein
MGVFGLCCFVGFGFEGLSGMGFVGVLAVLFGFLLLVWNLLCILPVYFGAPKNYISYKKIK